MKSKILAEFPEDTNLYTLDQECERFYATGEYRYVYYYRRSNGSLLVEGNVGECYKVTKLPSEWLIIGEISEENIQQG